MRVEQVGQRHPLPKVAHREHRRIGEDRPPDHQVEVRRDPPDLILGQ